MITDGTTLDPLVPGGFQHPVVSIDLNDGVNIFHSIRMETGKPVTHPVTQDGNQVVEHISIDAHIPGIRTGHIKEYPVHSVFLPDPFRTHGDLITPQISYIGKQCHYTATRFCLFD